jgi:hypothetical protein
MAYTFGRNMITTQLTREQVARLSDQELDAYARVVLDESRSRRSVLARARNYHGRQIIPTVILMVGVASSWIFSKVGWEPLIAFFASAALLQWHSAGINRRIDSLLDLIERDSIAGSEVHHTRTVHQDKNQEAEQDVHGNTH